ncbi:NAT_SF domain containing protein [uncultured Caudovirales phage]|uniref:NAT_SF domain containing protein n=1 Tax=uncultured Caudovirales phage TaxID=2100421 RepID=A0A6J5R8Q5_9CAUD|nr:NAT_SF domain containing protein [uncultured Caudovirales phage]
MSVLERVEVSPEEFQEFNLEHNKPSEEEDKNNRRILNDGNPVVVRWGIRCMGLKLDGKLVSINVTNFSKRPRKNAWGRYLNFYLAYTLPHLRRQGLATNLLEFIEASAIEQGYSRMKSLAGSWGGVRLHMSKGHHFYGVGKGGALIVDTPLASGMPFPEGIPIEARNACTAPELMTRESILHALSQKPFLREDAGDAVHRYFTERIRS